MHLHRKTVLRNASKSKASVAFLAVCWTLGICLGAYFAALSFDNVSFLMRTVVSNRVSISGMLLAAFFPLTLTAIFILFSLRFFLLLLAFCKAFSFSFCACCILYVYGSSGWLIQQLLLFSDLFLILILLWLWIRLLSSNDSIKKDLLICSFLSLFVGSVDCFIVSPFLVTLFN